MPSELLYSWWNALFTQVLDPRIVLQFESPFAESFADPQKVNFPCSNWVDQTPGSRTHCIQQAVPLTTCMVVPKA